MSALVAPPKNKSHKPQPRKPKGPARYFALRPGFPSHAPFRQKSLSRLVRERLLPLVSMQFKHIFRQSSGWRHIRHPNQQSQRAIAQDLNLPRHLRFTEFFEISPSRLKVMGERFQE